MRLPVFNQEKVVLNDIKKRIQKIKQVMIL